MAESSLKKHVHLDLPLHYSIMFLRATKGQFGDLVARVPMLAAFQRSFAISELSFKSQVTAEKTMDGRLKSQLRLSTIGWSCAITFRTISRHKTSVTKVNWLRLEQTTSTLLLSSTEKTKLHSIMAKITHSTA